MDVIGKKVKIIEMKDEPRYNGRIGVVTHVANAVPSIAFPEQWYGSWGSLAIQPEFDKVEIMD